MQLLPIRLKAARTSLGPTPFPSGSVVAQINGSIWNWEIMDAVVKNQIPDFLIYSS